MSNEITDSEFKFYTSEEIIELSSNVKLAQKRMNKLMQISRLSNAIRAILHKMGIADEKALISMIEKGEEPEGSLYDAFLVAYYERKAARKRLEEMPHIDKVVDLMILFFYVVQQDNPVYWKEMKEIAGAKSAKINQILENERKQMIEDME